MKNRLKKGYVQVYTGNGKGKTTAAIGLTLRAISAGLKVYFCQFLKGQNSSEIKYLKSNPESILFEKTGEKSFVKKAKPIDFKQARNCFHNAAIAIKDGVFDVVILDEIFSAISLNLINTNELEELLKLKPQHVEVVLTGRNAPKNILKMADLVTEMKEIKHYYNKGVQARKGIEK